MKVGKIKIDGVEKSYVDLLNVDWDVNTLDTFLAILLVAEDLDGYIEATIERDDTEIFGGRVQNPKVHFGEGGTGMTVDGFDYSIMLQDYLTPSQNIVDEDTEDALDLILTNWPFDFSTDGTFVYISLLEEWQTSMEFLMDIELYTDTCIEFAAEAPEINDEHRVGVIQSYGEGGLHNCFFYDGTTERFYIFYREGNVIFYDHSVDGTTWVRVTTTYACTTHRFGVAWHDNKVYLFLEDAGGNTDFYRGPVVDGTGAITFALIAGNIFANPIRFGPVWDDTGHIWVVEDIARGQAYESINDGLNWNPIFMAPANFNLWGLVPIGANGNLMCFVVDVIAEDLEEWLWDQVAGAPITFVRKIDDTSDDIDELQAAINHNYTPWVCWRDGNLVSVNHLSAGVWGLADSDITTGANGLFSFCCDAGIGAYLIQNRTAGTKVAKFIAGALDTEWVVPATYEWYISGARIGGSNPFAEEGDLGVFFCGIGIDEDGWFILFPPTGIRLYEGHATGSFRSIAVTASGAPSPMVYWGLLTSENTEVYDDWSILNNANALLLGGIETPYDLHYEGGLDPAETIVKVYCELEDTGDDPYVAAFDISERIDEITMDTDYEDCYIGVSRLADLAGAEFWVEKDNGTYTLYFSTRRGSDKSNVVVLKSAKTADYPDTLPNIKFLEKVFDWDRYANCILVIGDTIDGTRIEATLKDHTEIASFGQEVWKTIRDVELITESMARQKAAVELQSRNAVTLRISGRFLDDYDTGAIEIGDSVTLVAEWEDGDLKISGSHRIIQLSRTYGNTGERVDASFSNQMKAAEYWAYMQKTDTHERWISA